MASLLKPFPGLHLKLLALGPISQSRTSVPFPAVDPQAQSLAAKDHFQPQGRALARFAEAKGWHHGGINE